MSRKYLPRVEPIKSRNIRRRPPSGDTILLDYAAARFVVTGGGGFLGRSIVAALRAGVTSEAHRLVPPRHQVDLRDPEACLRLVKYAFSQRGSPFVLIHAAAISGGLAAVRREPERFFHDNRVMSLNLIDAAVRSGFADRGGVFVQVGHMSVYPAAAPQPYQEDSLGSGPLEPDLAPYGLAKLAALEALQAAATQHGLRAAFVIPTNLYGPGDTTDPQRSHAAGALLRRLVDATARAEPEVVCWGTGLPTRDFLYVDDAAAGVLAAAEWAAGPDPGRGVTPMNLSSGVETSIGDLARLIARHAGYTGRIVFDPTRPEGQPRRALDPTRAWRLMRWRAAVDLSDGIRRTLAAASGSPADPPPPPSEAEGASR